VIFVDSNVPMYLIGSDQRMKSEARRLLERAVSSREKLVTSAAVLQEILHRYCAINRREAIQPPFDILLGVAESVFEVSRADVERARDLILARPRLSARDGLHVAVMQRERVNTIMSFDPGFDGVGGITRLGRDQE
jgi:predicted nucleic acid-binding protein